MPKGGPWLTDEIETLIGLWGAIPSYSASQLAARLGRTRNAIAGKIYRLRVAGSVKAELKPGGAGKKFAINPRAGQPLRGVCSGQQKRDKVNNNKILAAIPPPLEFASEPGPLISIGCPCSVVELEPNNCKWPIGDPMAAEFHFCGAWTPSTRQPRYCRDHLRVAFRSGGNP
jgi:GcrA cell cycle regulator